MADPRWLVLPGSRAGWINIRLEIGTGPEAERVRAEIMVLARRDRVLTEAELPPFLQPLWREAARAAAGRAIRAWLMRMPGFRGVVELASAPPYEKMIFGIRGERYPGFCARASELAAVS